MPRERRLQETMQDAPSRRWKRSLLAGSLLAAGALGGGAIVVAQDFSAGTGPLRSWSRPAVTQAQPGVETGSPFDRQFGGTAGGPFDSASTSPQGRDSGLVAVQPSVERAVHNSTAGESGSLAGESRSLAGESRSLAGDGGSLAQAAFDSVAEPPVVPRPKTITAYDVARDMLDDARALAEQGQVHRARQLARQAERFPVTWEESEESPTEFLARLEEMPEPSETAPVSTLSSARSKVIYPALGPDQAEALRRLPDTQTEGAPGQLATGGEDNLSELPEGGQEAQPERLISRNSKVLEIGPPIPFKLPQWRSFAKPAPNANPQLGPADSGAETGGAEAPEISPAPVEGASPAVPENRLDLPGASRGPATQGPALAARTVVGGWGTPHADPSGHGAPSGQAASGAWTPSLDSYRRHAFTSESGTKVIDGREALRMTQQEWLSYQERLHQEELQRQLAMRGSQAGSLPSSVEPPRPLMAAPPAYGNASSAYGFAPQGVAPASGPGAVPQAIEMTSSQQPPVLAAAPPPQLLRIEAAGQSSAAAAEASYLVHHAPLLTFLLGLVLCPLTLALCFALAIKQIAKHKGPIFQVEFSGGGPWNRSSTAKRRNREADEDDDWDQEPGDGRKLRRQRPKRRSTAGPSVQRTARQTRVIDPTTGPMPPLPAMPSLAEQRRLEEQQQKDKEQAILQTIFERNVELRQQLRALNGDGPLDTQTSLGHTS